MMILFKDITGYFAYCHHNFITVTLPAMLALKHFPKLL